MLVTGCVLALALGSGLAQAVERAEVHPDHTINELDEPAQHKVREIPGLVHYETTVWTTVLTRGPLRHASEPIGAEPIRDTLQRTLESCPLMPSHARILHI